MQPSQQQQQHSQSSGGPASGARTANKDDAYLQFMQEMQGLL